MFFFLLDFFVGIFLDNDLRENDYKSSVEVMSQVILNKIYAILTVIVFYQAIYGGSLLI